jgi:hypothetical protein
VNLDIEGGNSEEELEKIIETKQAPSGPILDELRQAVGEIEKDEPKVETGDKKAATINEGKPLESALPVEEKKDGLPGASYGGLKIEEKLGGVVASDDLGGDDEDGELPDELGSQPMPAPPTSDEDELDRVATESGLDFEPITMPNGTVLPPPPPPPIPDFADLGDLVKTSEKPELPKLGEAPDKTEPLGASYASKGVDGGGGKIEVEPLDAAPSGVSEPGLPPVMMGGLPPVNSAHGAPALDVPDLSEVSTDAGGAEQFRIPT